MRWLLLFGWVMLSSLTLDGSRCCFLLGRYVAILEIPYKAALPCCSAILLTCSWLSLRIPFFAWAYGGISSLVFLSSPSPPGQSTEPDPGEPHAGPLFHTWTLSTIGNTHVSFVLAIPDPNTTVIAGLCHQSCKSRLSLMSGFLGRVGPDPRPL